MSRAPTTDPDRITTPSAADRDSYGAAFERLVGVMARLRAEDGCPWDRAQDLESLRTYLIEEAYEVLDAIDGGDAAAHEEELGDLLLQVVFQAEVQRQAGRFDAADVAHGIADKLVRRHPHVFGDDRVDGQEQAYGRWEAMKAAERPSRSVLAGVPSALPALLKAQRVGEKAARTGFDWGTAAGAFEKVREEVDELAEALEGSDPARIEAELGDALFALVNVARLSRVSAEDALRGTIARFTRRFQSIEAAVRLQGRALTDASLEEMEALWQAAKREE